MCYVKHWSITISYYLVGKHGISSVAVLGHMGMVLGNISLTDVKVSTKSYAFTSAVNT